MPLTFFIYQNCFQDIAECQTSKMGHFTETVNMSDAWQGAE